MSDAVAFRRQRPLPSPGPPCSRAPPLTPAPTGWSSGLGCPGACAHLAPFQANQCARDRHGGVNTAPSGLSACLDGACPGDSLRQAGGRREARGAPPASAWLAVALRELKWFGRSSGRGAPPGSAVDVPAAAPWEHQQPPEPPPQFPVNPSLRPAARPAERRSQGLCPRVQKWFYEKFGEYVEDFRFQPEESTVETEEPLSARRWGPGRVGAAGHGWPARGPPGCGSWPCWRGGPACAAGKAGAAAQPCPPPWP